jgi:hypothetical protein
MTWWGWSLILVFSFGARERDWYLSPQRLSLALALTSASFMMQGHVVATSGRCSDA